MNKNLKFALIGNGGHARVIRDIARLNNMGIAVVVVPDQELAHSSDSSDLMSETCFIQLTNSREHVLLNGVGPIPSESRNVSVVQRWTAAGYRFAKLIHPSALIAADVQLSEDAQVMASVTVQPGVKIGPTVILNSGCTIDHDCEILCGAFVGPGAILCGGVRIGRNVFVGASATILPNVTVGDSAIVGAGAVVTSDVLEGQTVVGNPATLLTHRKPHC